MLFLIVMQKLSFLFLIILLHFNFFAQEIRTYPDYFPPVSIPMILAGNFGELRANHFHMGIDIKTQGKEGLEIRAVDDGFVSRVKISTYGYGKVVYIDHPNGITSVYAHCSKMVGKLNSLVYAEQKRTQDFEVELFFKPGEMTVSKGDVFALTGNTGGSSAPHLHFEVRDTKTEHALNPLVFAFDIKDTRAPELRKIKVFAVNEQGYLVPGKSLERVISKKNVVYSIFSDTLKVPASFCSSFGGLGLAFDGIDRLDGAENICGLYGTYLIADTDTVFGQRIDGISFNETRYINSHRDMTTSGTNYHKSFRNVSNPLGIYINEQLGVINMLPGESKNMRYITYDTKGNMTSLDFVLHVLPGEMSSNYNPPIDSYWYPENTYSLENEKWSIEADSFSIYEPYLLNSKSTPHICDISTHLQKRVKVRMKLEDPKLPFEKYYLSVGNKALTTHYKDGWLEAETNASGNLTIRIDDTPPVIKPINASYTLKSPIVKFHISDTQSGLADYDVFIGDEWVLLEYDHKGGIAFFEVPATIKGEHLVKVVVKDACENVSTFERLINFE